MKKSLFSLFFLLSISLSLHAQEELEVPHTHMPVITKIAATWCPPCGAWGWTFFENLLEDNSEKAVIFVAHHSGDLINEVASALTTNYGATYQPEYYLNGIDQEVNSGNTAAKRMAVKEMVDQMALTPPIAQTGLKALYAEYLGGTLFVNYKTEFFQNTSGEYYLGLYLVEKIVIANQASIGPNAEHENIIRKELTGNNFGTLIASGDIAEGVLMDTSMAFSASLEEYERENLEIVSIIWKKEGEKYLVVNANRDSDVEITDVLDALDDNDSIDASFKVEPSLIRHSYAVNFSLPVSIKNTEIRMINIEGKTVAVLYKGFLSKGQNNLSFTRPNNLPAGIYFIRLKVGTEVVSRRIVLE